MSLSADKKLWDKLHEDLKKKSETLLAYEIELGAKYGHNFQTQWLSTAQKKKLEKLRDAKEKTGEKIYELVARISPRQWDRGVPSWWVRSELTWEDAIRPKNEPLSVIVPGSYGVPDGTVKETPVEQDPETAGIEYATAQLESDYFMDWVREQLAEAADMDPNDVLPLETKQDARVIAKNMLQQLEWDTQRAGAAQEELGNEATREEINAFYDGLKQTLRASREWLADELLTIKGEMSERRAGEARRTGRTHPRAMERYRSAPITRVVIQQGDPNLQRQGYTKQQALTNWVAKVYDSEGNLRSGVNSPDKEYVEKKIAEWFPGVPVEYGQPELRPGAQRRARKPVVRAAVRRRPR